MNIHISPEAHFRSKDIQSSIKKYYSCADVTGNGSECRSSLTTNKFTDKLTGKQWNCNSYCMRQCTPQKLVHLFEKVPIQINTNANKYPIFVIYLEFISSGTNESIMFTYLSHSWRLQGINISPAVMSSVLCGWLRHPRPPGTIIDIVAVVYAAGNAGETINKNSETFEGFDIPYIRPAKEWEINRLGGLSLNFKLSDSSLVSPVLQSEKSSIPIDLKEVLPIELAELPESLVYHGIAHPDIHRISRKHRKASQHRPRHFHSPVRKEYKGKKKIKK